MSLVKYDTPSLLTTKEKKGSKPAKSGKKLPPVEGAKQAYTEDILNSILPPRRPAALLRRIYCRARFASTHAARRVAHDNSTAVSGTQPKRR